MLYTSPLFFSSQGQIIHLRLDLIYSSFFILVEMEKHANLLLSLSHGLASVLRDLHSHEAIRTRAINSAWKIQLCSARLCLQLLRKKKKRKKNFPVRENVFLGYGLESWLLGSSHLTAEGWIIQALWEMIVFSYGNCTAKHLKCTLEGTAWVLPAGWRHKFRMSCGAQLCAFTEAGGPQHPSLSCSG